MEHSRKQLDKKNLIQKKMKKIITLAAIALFAMNINAQETKPVAKETAKTEKASKSKMKDAKNCSKEEMAKCKKDAKKCCAK